MSSHNTLFSRTLELLRETDTPLLVIYKETDLPYYWLQKLKDGKISDPSVNRMQHLYEYLSGRSLKV